MINYTAFGSATVRMYDMNDELIGNAFMTLTKGSTLSLSASNTEQRAGLGNALIANFVHSKVLTASITAATLNLAYVAKVYGSTYNSSTTGNIFKSETVTLSGKSGTVTGTPALMETTTYYAQVSYTQGNVMERVVLSGQNFTVTSADIPNNATVCVTYYQSVDALSGFKVSATSMPSVVRLVIEQGVGVNETEGFAGRLHYEIPRFQFDGKQDLSIAPDGFTDFGYNGMALAYDDGTSCESLVYSNAYLEIFNKVWYDGLVGLGIAGMDSVSGATAEEVPLTIFGKWSDSSATNYVDATKLTFTVSTDAGTVDGDTGILTIGTVDGTVTITPTAIDGHAVPSVSLVVDVTVET